MKRQVTAVLGAVALVVMANAAAAQEKPNFSGKWEPDAEKTAAANPNAGGGGGGGGRGGRGGGMAGPMTLAIEGVTLTITREGQNGPMVQTYKLDDSEQTVTMGQGEAKVKAKWDGATIVVVTTRQGQNGAVTTTAVYSIEGNNLVVATTQPARGGGDPTTTKRYFKKAA